MRIGFLPTPPLVLREYASTADPGAEVRRRCRAVLDALGDGEAVVLTCHDRHPSTSSRPPLGERVVADLTGRSPRVLTVPFDATADEVAAVVTELERLAPEALVVAGDGSARRGQKAPGHLDERSFALDAAVAEALADGRPEPLASLDTHLSAELMASGRAVWQVVGAYLRDRRVTVRTATSDDPFGVCYHWAVWET